MTAFKKAKVDLIQSQKSYYDSSVRNFEISNSSMAHLQTGILTINLALLTFIGASELQQDEPSRSAFFSATLLIIGLFAYIFGLYRQWGWTLRGAREQFDLSQKVLTYIHERNKQYVDKLPNELKETKKGRTNHSANRLIFSSLVLTLLGAITALCTVSGRITW